MTEPLRIPRLPDWQARLALYMAGLARAPLVYGQHDCALFAAGAVMAMTGHDPAAPWRGRYSSLAGGLRVLRRAGHADHIDVVRKSFPAVPVAQAVPGDLALFETAEGPSLGVVQGAGVYVLHARGHLGLMPLTEAVEVFAT